MSLLDQWLLVFAALFFTDVCWAFYITKVKEGSPLHAAMWAVFLYITGSVGTISVVHNPVLLVPAGLGAFTGTYVAVWMNRNKTKESK